VTSFIGREHVIHELTDILDRTRILTLTGAGGVGKTRLALQLMAAVAGRYADGVWLVELAPLSDPRLVVREIAAALEVREQRGRPLIDTLSEVLRPRQALILLDNCEHLIAQCASVVESLTRACPQLRILATSREALGIAGEVDWRVPSLDLPDPGRLPPLERLARFEAVQLLVDRATAAQPSFHLTEQNAPAVAQICHRLDGIPLAIELAAARIKALSAEQIAARLDDLFRLLTTGSRTALPRQQTLRATVDWSYELLSEPERRLFMRLSAFAGGWTLEAAQAICADESIDADDVLDLLAHLVDRSLVLAEPDEAEVRYRLLEPMRQYAAEQLAASGEESLVRARHLDWYVRFALHADEQLQGPQLRTWMSRLEAEYDNVRSALTWAAAQEDRTGAELELCGALLWFWWERDHVREGRELVEHALSRSLRASDARARALATAGWLAHFDRDQVAARAWIQESLDIARALGSQRAVAWALHILARTHYFDGDAAIAHAIGEESLAIARELGDPWLIAWAIHVLGLASYVAGEFAAARAQFEESLAIRREIGHVLGIHILQNLLGFVAHREGDFVQAAALQAETLRTGSDLRLGNSVDHGLMGLAALAVECAQPERAVRLAAAAFRRSQIVGVIPIPISQELLGEALERARQALSPEAYSAAWAEGLSMSEEQSVAEALAVASVFSERGAAAAQADRNGRGGGPSPIPPMPSTAPLTRREIEVLGLMVKGRTSKEIAAELVISVPTVDRHITHIYAKIGARRRGDAIAYAVTHGLA
jgi:non-specific serine/threonine protein kinase